MLLGFSVPAVAHNEANMRRLNEGNCQNLVAHNSANTSTDQSCQLGTRCTKGQTCTQNGSEYVCCRGFIDGACMFYSKEMCNSRCN